VPKNYEQLLTLALFVRVLLGIRIYKAMKHGNDKFISAEKSEILENSNLCTFEFPHFFAYFPKTRACLTQVSSLSGYVLCVGFAGAESVMPPLLLANIP